MQCDKCSKSVRGDDNQRAASCTGLLQQDTVPIAPYNQQIPYHIQS